MREVKNARGPQGHMTYGTNRRNAYQILEDSLNLKDSRSRIHSLISAAQKLVIRDVVLYADNKIEQTKEIITHS